MKKFLLLIFSAAFCFEAFGQNKQSKVFTMPSGVSHVRGRVMVKVKDEFKGKVLQMSQQGARFSVGASTVNSARSFAKGISQQGLRSRPQTVDLTKYFSLEVDPNQSVEDVVNNLYATNYFEIVEPEYLDRIDFTPNDPSISSQYYLTRIKALDAWDITKGDTSIVIAIVDTGGNLTHIDLSPNLFRNWSEYPPNGVDDDGNGYIDDYRGWDFMGADTLNITKSNFVGDNDPSINHVPALTNVGELSHGTWVGGCASAATNNGVGIAGVGYKTRLMFVKHTADNQRVTSPGLYSTINGILYAGDLFSRHNIKGIINCSFGGAGRSQVVQDIITHVVVDLNCVIVAAAGNSDTSSPSFPGAYDHVLSVAATDQNDVRASFSNYGSSVDLAAPGVSIFTTQYNNTYGIVDGTSFSSPITAGAAALVWSKNPDFTASQVAEQLRVSADGNALYSANPTMINQLGTGRLDVSKALSLSLPSIRASNLKVVNQNGEPPLPGDKAYLTFDFTNYLKSTSTGIQISITTNSTVVSITKGKITPGVIAAGATISNNLTPFELSVGQTTAQNILVSLVINYTDGAYSDFQLASFYVNPSFIDVNTNQISTTVTAIGRIGYQDTQNDARTQGSGFIFNDNQMIFEMGLIMGTSSSVLYNNVRSTVINSIQNYDQDFTSTLSIKQITPGVRSTSEIFGEFANVATGNNSAKFITVDYRSLVWKDSPYDKFVILEYQIVNPTLTSYNNFYFGIFSDWDITADGANDAAGWDATNNIGYVYPAQEAARPYGGIQILTGSPAYYAIDNNPSIQNNPFGIYDGFSDSEKFTTISASIGSGRERLQAGVTGTAGNDVSHVVSTGPFNIAAGQSVTVAFALHAAANLSDLQKSASYADSVYNYTLKAPKPTGDSTAVCYNTPATLNVSGASSIKWYTSFTGGQSFHTGNQFTTGNLKGDTAFYISNADQVYESVRVPVKVTVKASPRISTSGSPKLCEGNSITLSVPAADSTVWSDGEKTNTIQVSTAGKFSVRVKDLTLNCSAQSDTISVTVSPTPTADFTISGDSKTQVPISFTDKSTDAVSWFWDFGDGQSSVDQSPSHTYSNSKNYSVSLTVTASDGCTDMKISPLPIITEIQEQSSDGVMIYPNPITNNTLHIVIDNEDLRRAQISLSNALGQSILVQDISSSTSHSELEVPVSGLSAGIYIIRVSVGEKTITKKLVKAF
ncbi:MAG: S8 family serine peptidase [Cyclobacteriaceae bacterium]